MENKDINQKTVMGDGPQLHHEEAVSPPQTAAAPNLPVLASSSKKQHSGTRSSTNTSYGDSSVTSERISAPIHQTRPGRTYDSRPFFQSTYLLVKRGDSRVLYDAAEHGVVLSSPLIRPMLSPEVPATMILGGYQNHLKLTLCHDILYDSPVITSSVDASAFGSFLTGAVVNDLYITGALNSVIGNQTLARELAQYFLFQQNKYDNTALYIKGTFYSFLQFRIEQENVDVRYPPYPANPAITHINLMEPQSGGSAIMFGAFVMVVGSNFRLTDLDIIYWLACPGRRISPGAAPSIAVMAIMWPAIPFCILRRGGPPPQAPAPGAINPNRLWNFVNNLASNRVERDYFVLGVYEAAFLINSVLLLAHRGNVVPDDILNRPDTDSQGQLIKFNTLNDIPAESRGLEWYCLVTPTLESFGEQYHPKPCDYCVLQRLLGLRGTDDNNFLSDYLSLNSLSMIEKLLHCAILAGFTTVFVTTALQSYNVYGTVIQQAAVSSQDTPPLFLKLAKLDGFFRNHSGTAASTALIFLHTLALADEHVGGVIPLSTLTYRSWNLPHSQWGFEGPFLINSPHHPPRLGTPLAILGWLDTLPSEWGIVDHHAQIDVRKDVHLYGSPTNRGWYCTLGSNEYHTHRLNNMPYTLIIHSALIMNAISQGLQHILPAGEVQFQYQSLIVSLTGVNCLRIADRHPHPPIWLKEHHIFEPCTVITYVWERSLIFVPFLNEIHSNQTALFVLKNVPIGPEFSKGYMLSAEGLSNLPLISFSPSRGLKRTK